MKKVQEKSSKLKVKTLDEVQGFSYLQLETLFSN